MAEARILTDEAELEVWRGLCSMCPAHTIIVVAQPPPTQCVSCLAPLTDVEQTTIKVSVD